MADNKQEQREKEGAKAPPKVAEYKYYPQSY